MALNCFSHVQREGSDMKTPTLGVLRACSVTIALLGSVAVIAAVSIPDMAFAKSGNDGNGNGNGGGNGNGNGNGNGGGKANGNGNGGNAKSTESGGEKSKSEKSKTKSDSAETSKKSKTKASARTNRLADELGISASELGALNAAHANANAFKNASPNSRVGRIGAYRDAVLEGRALEAELEEKAADLDAMTPPDRALAEIRTDLDDAVDNVAAKSGDVARLEAELAGAGGTDPAIEADLADARAALAEAEAAELALQDELASAEAYADLAAEVSDLETRLEDQPDLERALLEGAANKPVTDAVEAAVKRLLGL